VKEFSNSLGSVSAVIGAQWGDEGKGKVTDILAEHFDVIARACGGANAGHTIVVDGTKHVFHLLPSGCLHEGKPVILGPGMVIHLPTLLEEITTLKDGGIDIVPRLHISHAAHIVFDFHKEIDGAMEEDRIKEGAGIGTTKRGIGPAYTDKAVRSGVRMESLGTDISAILEKKAKCNKRVFEIDTDIALELANMKTAHDIIGGCITDTVTLIHKLRSDGKTILVEGAQASMLDLDHGTYPFVTSSSTTASGALQGLGLPPSALNTCIGVAKAYCTRVGDGPFDTEVEGDVGDALREKGGEYGATTGRPRRCGWLSIPDLIRSAQINGFTHWNITKLDVLDDLAEIPVGVGDGKLETLPGWQSSTVGMTNYSDLPDNAKGYIEFIEKRTGVPVGLIGTGQGREEMIVKN